MATDWQRVPGQPSEAAPFDGEPVMLCVAAYVGTAYTLPTITACNGYRVDPNCPVDFYIARWRRGLFETTETIYDEYATVEAKHVWRWAKIDMPELHDD